MDNRRPPVKPLVNIGLKRGEFLKLQSAFHFPVTKRRPHDFTCGRIVSAFDSAPDDDMDGRGFPVWTENLSLIARMASATQRGRP